LEILKINNLNVDIETAGGVITAVSGANLTLNKGEILAIAGESGSGKSMTCKAVMNLLPRSAKITGGSVKADGRCAMVFQDPLTSLDPTLPVGKQIEEAILIRQPELKGKSWDGVVSLLDQVGLDEPEARAMQYPANLSGGMRQRVVIAMALAMQSEILIADEPTTALDVTIQDEILKLLKKLCLEQNKSMLLVTHDLSVAREIADRIAVMKDGKVIETGTAAEILDNPKEEYTRALVEASKLHHEEHRAPGEVILEVKNLCHTFTLGKGRGKRKLEAVKDISFELRDGEILGIVGESGSGKSTLLRCIMNLHKIQQGSVIYKGIDTSDSKEYRANRQLLQSDRQVILQDSQAALNHRMKVADIITEPLQIQRRTTARGSYREEAIFQLQYVGMDESYADRYPSALSGGQRQRVAIARALTMDPGLLVCDEPVSSLDMQIQAQVIKLLRHMREEHGCSIIFVTHDLRAARMLCDRVVVMKSGKLMEIGETEEVFRNPKDEYTKKLIAAIPGEGGMLDE